ncbi:cupin domain-containing protein [Roseibium suaedae]|uniref:Anti-ECFsigma factor, ChrR n=1 Tax=Roseibium suaedae TaxID=735517 RepID=A0A1M7BM63_9HYPH|nr:cupin domain-containing protein [Roseibium suaedae]SHL55659.1 anti-ECFsigma factor, ChrR [Roseibium suaedae]
MQIHADLSKKAVVASAELPWIPSPMQGVERRMLERDGAEVARATSLVRYAPGSAFSAHSHDMGEEFLVLEGTFSDETGDYGRGMYVRNPPGSSHTPNSRDGAVILVKLRQMAPWDNHVVRVDTSHPQAWQDGRPGEAILPLFANAHEQVDMIDWDPEVKLPSATFPGGVEYFVLAGTLEDDEGSYPAGTWLRLPPGTSQSVRTLTGVRVWRKTGHLLGAGFQGSEP